jgi:hypothetical protein
MFFGEGAEVAVGDAVEAWLDNVHVRVRVTGIEGDSITGTVEEMQDDCRKLTEHSGVVVGEAVAFRCEHVRCCWKTSSPSAAIAASKPDERADSKRDEASGAEAREAGETADPAANVSPERGVDSGVAQKADAIEQPPVRTAEVLVEQAADPLPEASVAQSVDRASQAAEQPEHLEDGGDEPQSEAAA